MKTLYSLLALVFIATVSQAQTAVYMRLIDYKNVNIYNQSVKFNTDPNAKPIGGKTSHADEVALTTFSDGEVQTTNIGSQSTGAGAGKVTFSPVVFSKIPDIISPQFFTSLASGTAYKFVEFSFYKVGGSGGNGEDILRYKIRLALVAFTTIQRAAATCNGDCPDLIENFSMEYGGKYITYYPQNPNGTVGNPEGEGWNRIKNLRWNGEDEIK